MTQDYLKEHFRLKDGDLITIKASGRNSKLNKIAGCINGKGYRVIRINKKLYLAHRLIWLYEYGNFPEHQLDHINGNRQDNRLVNLREVTHKENCKNQRLSKNNNTGIAGVGWHKASGKWRVRIGNKYLGVWDTLDEATHVRKLAETEEGYHKNHGKSFEKIRQAP